MNAPILITCSRKSSGVIGSFKKTHGNPNPWLKKVNRKSIWGAGGGGEIQVWNAGTYSVLEICPKTDNFLPTKSKNTFLVNQKPSFPENLNKKIEKRD